jgi:hypothetical protein
MHQLMINEIIYREFRLKVIIVILHDKCNFLNTFSSTKYITRILDDEIYKDTNKWFSYKIFR